MDTEVAGWWLVVGAGLFRNMKSARIEFQGGFAMDVVFIVIYSAKDEKK